MCTINKTYNMQWRKINILASQSMQKDIFKCILLNRKTPLVLKDACALNDLTKKLNTSLSQAVSLSKCLLALWMCTRAATDRDSEQSRKWGGCVRPGDRYTDKALHSHTLTHQDAHALLRKKAERTSNFHGKTFRLLDFIMSHDTADFQCKYLALFNLNLDIQII